MTKLEKWEKATQELSDQFVEKHFGKVDDADMWWVSDSVGDALYINDYWFNFSSIVDYTKYKYTSKEMFDYYDYALEAYNKGLTIINIKNWKKLKTKGNLEIK